MSAEKSRTRFVPLWCWLGSLVIFFGAFVVGSVYAATGPGGDTERSWAAITFPFFASALCVPLLLVGVVVAIYVMVHDRPRAITVTALVLCLIALTPAALFLATLVH